MDRVEDIDRDRAGVRLSERNVNTERVSKAETDKEVSAMLKGYDLGLSDRDDERSPPKLELAHEYRNPSHSPLLRHLLLLQWTPPVSASGLCQLRSRLR